MIDFNLDTDKAVIIRDIELIFQQIDLLFDTNPKEVLGDDKFGSNYDRYLHNLQISNEGIRQKVLSDISSLELFDYKPEVEVYLLQGTEQDIALVNIILKNDISSFEKSYNIS